MEDPYQFVENVDEKTIKYFKEQTVRFKQEFGNVPEALRSQVSEYNNTRNMFQAVISDNHVISLYEMNGRYSVKIDGKELHSTNNIIVWAESSNDGRRIAIFETSGSDFGTLKIFDNFVLKEEIKDKVSSILFTDSSYYLVKTFSDHEPPDGGELNSHRVMKNGKIVFGSGFSSKDFISLRRSRDKVIVTVGDWNHSSLYVGDIDDPGTWKKIRDINSPVKPLGIRDGEVVCLEKKEKGIIRKGEQIVLEAQDPIEDCVMVDEGFLVLHLVDARISPALYDFSGKMQKTLKLDLPMGLKFMESDEHSATVVLTSFGTPYSFYKYEKGELKKLEENRVLDLDIEDRWVDSSGTAIHYFLVNKPLEKEKKALAYGYGGFNISLSPMYSPLFATLLENGITVALANLRGGGEYGEEWHLAGTREKKQNVFDDFISVINELKRDDYKVVALGASNGGLLVGSILTQKPQILDGAVIGNPVLDMLRFHLMSVGKYWVSEYGDPGDQKDAEFLAKYSPYHNVREMKYPKVMIYSRINDDRVHPAHAIKFHMKLNKVKADAYLRVSEGGGHIGIPPEEMITEICETSNFVLKCLD